VRNVTLRIDTTMEAVLQAFSRTGGYATTGYLVDEVGTSRPTITKRLDRLHAADCIEYVHEPTAFWELVSDPRADTQQGADTNEQEEP
jgi:Mn-dependent DtxR family transcriptional regulator